jgi:hypothetical protein
MNFNRRIFMSLLLAPPKRTPPPQVAVLETFTINEKAVTVLVNHGREDARDAFAQWLQANPRSRIRIRNKAGEETGATAFRVRMCFGRGLIVLDKPIPIRERETLTIVN